MAKKIFQVIFVIILIVAIVIFFFIKTFNINKYKSKIESEISDATNHSVKIEELSLDFSIADGVPGMLTRMEDSDPA